jgi:hypothetical protein
MVGMQEPERRSDERRMFDGRAQSAGNMRRVGRLAAGVLAVEEIEPERSRAEQRDRGLVFRPPGGDHVVALAEAACPIPVGERMRPGTAGGHRHHDRAGMRGDEAGASQDDVVEVWRDRD